MSLSVSTRFPGGNAAGVSIQQRDGYPEIRFASDPCGGAEALWFYFRIEESNPDPERHSKIRLTWTLIDNVTGGDAPAVCVPVSSAPGHTWTRLKQGEESRNAEGLRELSWWLPHPAPSAEVAFCFPYGKPELDNAVEKSRDFWHSAPIGISQGGRTLTRVFNTMGTSSAQQPGVFVIARQHAGETPASWVLDGLLRQWAVNRKGGYVIWTVPLADIDGIEWGWYGRENLPYDLERAWSDPPLRHEALAIRNDVLRWRARCKPILALDLHATGAFEKDGVYAYASASGEPTAAEETKWCNLIKNELKADYAAPDFQRVDDRLSRSVAPAFVAWIRRELGIAALRIQAPYGQIGGQALTQKSYREIGQRLAQAVMRRNG
ncbi:MAG TPA: hypothetical protein PKA21_16785 [Kiritimatiellia bacterium]|nr:hypothetical protein [Kiritimatiellia bacterium]